MADAFRRLVVALPRHDTIVQVLDAGLEGMTAYLVSEYVVAETLDVALRHLAPAPLDRALPILSQLADAIDTAAEAGLVHGALHPRDVFVELDTNEVRVAGFGVVPAIAARGLRTPIRHPYSAPERVNGEAWDGRADVYSLGAMAHELLTRRRPAGPGEQDGTLTSETSPEQRVLIRRVLSAALAERPQHRFASARAFVEALEAVARGDGGVAIPEATDAEEEETGEQVSLAGLAAFDEAQEIEGEAIVEVGVVPPVEPDDAARPMAAPIVERAVADGPPAPMPPERAARPPEDAAVASDEDHDWATSAAATSPMWDADARRSFDPPVRPIVRRAAETGDLGLGHGPLGSLPERSVSASGASFPWAALVAVALAAIALGFALGYSYARRATPAVPSGPVVGASRAGAPGDTDVAVPNAAVPPPAASPEGSAAPAGAATVPPPPPVVRPTEPVAVARGRLDVRSTPAGAMVVVDGRPAGETPAVVKDLALGQHTIEVARPGYVPHTEQVTLSARRVTQTLSVALRPGAGASSATRPPAAGMGSIYVELAAAVGAGVDRRAIRRHDAAPRGGHRRRSPRGAVGAYRPPLVRHDGERDGW